MIIDSGHLMETLFGELWWLILLFAGIAVFRSHAFKVLLGSWMVNLAARTQLDGENYHLLKNVTLHGVDGETWSGHIVVSRYGVFLVEAISMQGWIFAGYDECIWTWKFHSTTHEFENPLHQRKNQMKMIEQALDLDSYMMFPVVTFVGDNTFMTQMPENVTQGTDYIRYIKSKRKIVLTEDDVTDILQRIQSGRLCSSKDSDDGQMEHVQGSGEAV